MSSSSSSSPSSPESSSSTATNDGPSSSNGRPHLQWHHQQQPQQQQPQPPWFLLWGWIPAKYESIVKGVGGVFLALFSAAPIRIMTAIGNVIWTAIGVALGVGFGLGLAMHVYEQLQRMSHENTLEKHKRNPQQQFPSSSSQQQLRRLKQMEPIRPSISGASTLSRSNSIQLEDGSSYGSLMALAGYPVQSKVLRGQVLKADADFWDVQYKFTRTDIPLQRGPQMLQADWPGLPTPVTRELGRFVEHLMRDYISGWYSKLDGGCLFIDEKGRRANGIPRDTADPSPPQPQPSPTTTTSTISTTTSTAEDTKDSAEGVPLPQTQARNRRMVYSTLTHRPIPLLDQMYRVLSIAFGSLATRAEHVNILSLALLKWTQVLAHTFKVYRQLRKAAETKNDTTSPTEVQMAREFLLAGKLHKAVTFGLDVPSLLFADANGTECGTTNGIDGDGDGDGDGDSETPTTTSTNNNNRAQKDPNHVLEERLFHKNSTLLKECELDYNRVVASRLIKSLLPRTDSQSPVVTALVTEIMSTSVLQPLMNLWIPSFLNELVVNSMSGGSSNNNDNENESDNAGTERAEEAATTVTSGGDGTNGTDSSLLSPEDSRRTSNNRYPFSQNASTNSEVDSADRSSHDEALTTSNIAPLIPPSRAMSQRPEESVDLADEEINDRNQRAVGKLLLKLSSIALQELQRYVNFDECRVARLNHREDLVDYDDPACQGAVLRLVMVVEAALLHGRCAYRQPQTISTGGEAESAPTLPDGQPTVTLAQLWMEMTSDMVVFERQMDSMKRETRDPLDMQSDMDFVVEPNEISTVRTLISTWMHTGQLSRALSLIIKGMDTVFHPYYSDDAFLAVERTAAPLLQQMGHLEGVDILVETMAVLASPRLDIEAEADSIPAEVLDSPAARQSYSQIPHSSHHDELHSPSASDLMAHNVGTTSTPRFLDFHKNSAFAASLRTERERRMRSWETQKCDESLTAIQRPGVSSMETELHQELHNLARTFYNGTNVLTMRDAARKQDALDGEESSVAETSSESTNSTSGKVSLITVETVSSRRRMEVPDDDSSFLLRAQPRPLNPVSVHRDDRNHDLSYKCFLATYEEPTVSAGPNRYCGGRYIRRCFLQYYPIDRTSTIILHNDARKLDRRKGKAVSQDQLNQQKQPPAYLSGAFLRERHLCQKWVQKGSSAQTFLSSSVMEATDFNATPRSGKALDFVYRMSLFERPRIDLAGKRFIVQDSAARGPHRSDSSALEVSDASLSALLFGIGKDYGREETESAGDSAPEKVEYRHKVETGLDGYPMLFMKFTPKTNDDNTGTEIKPYRMSFVRAALMITSARHEAQLQCLMECVKAGSAKSATKARTEAHLKPTLKILEFANDRSSDRVRTSSLLRDLKLGVYHIDREQLRRNGLLNPRSPTSIVDLTAKVVEAVQAKEVAELFGSNKVAPTSTLYKIHCVATVELIGGEDDLNDLEPYVLDDGSLASTYKEEWEIYRSMKDFQAFHKHLKTQVGYAGSSASTGSRLVGAATAAFSTGNQGQRHRKALIPSLAQASKTGAIAVTQKAIVKRGELLHDYLEYLLHPGHIINRCMELLLFLGASLPFPSEIHMMQTPVRLVDPLGRTCFLRSVAARGPDASAVSQGDGNGLRRTRLDSDRSRNLDGIAQAAVGEQRETVFPEAPEDSDLDISILNKVDQVPLAEVRNRMVELVKYQFGFENASFFRSRLLSALEAASFVAMTKGSEFQKLLYNTHVQQLNPDAIGSLIEKVMNMLWPDGCWLVPRPALSPKEESNLKEDSRQKLHDTFPEQIRAILGRGLTRDGLDMVHEMLQNRLVVKSLFYMLFDLLWIEVFPELRDALPCASALDID